MKKVVGVVAVLLVWAEISCAQSWVTVQVNKYAKIDFPTTPNIMYVAGQKIYYIKEEKDSTSLFMITVADSLSVPQDEIQGFYSNIIGNSVEKVGGALISLKELVVDTFSGREILYTRHMDEALLAKTRILYSKNSSYVYSHLFTNKTDTTTEKKFFESFRLSNNEADAALNSQAETTRNKMSYLIGYYGGELVFFLLIIGVAVVCFRVIRNRLRKT